MRGLLADRPTLFVPGCYNALTARILEHAGFPAVYIHNTYNMTGVSPRFTLEQMQELGIAIAIAPGALLRATIQAAYDLAVALREDGPLAEAAFSEQFRKHPLGDLHTFAGFDRVRRWGTRSCHLEKYERSVGHQPSRATSGGGAGAP
jgi:2-methylisocitrate lyase-like PEP mutase family enzyme